jgi:hypothetical protein
VTIEGQCLECEASETVVYIAPYCSGEIPQTSTFVASTAGQYQLGQLIVPCTTSTAINYYAPTIVIVNNIQVTLSLPAATPTSASGTLPSSIPPSGAWSTSSPISIDNPGSDDDSDDDNDYTWTCSGAIDVDEIASQEDPLIAAIEYQLQKNLTADQISQVQDVFYNTYPNGSNATSLDLSFLYPGYAWNLTFSDYEDELDPWVNCSTPYNISVDYPDYYNFGNGTEEDPDVWDVSEFVLDNDTDSNSTYSSLRLFIRQTNLLTPNTRLYNADLWVANGMDAFMQRLLTTYPALKTPSQYGFISDMLDAVGLGTAATGFQKCDISTCDQVEWKDSWTDQQKKVYYIFYAIRTRMLWLKAINENLGVVQTNTLGNMQSWIDRWWPTDVDKRGVKVDSGIADMVSKVLLELSGLIPYVGKVIKFGASYQMSADAKSREALAIKMRGTSWAEFGQAFTGTGGLLDTYRTAVSTTAQALNSNPTAEMGAVTAMMGGNFFGQPTVHPLSLLT